MSDHTLMLPGQRLREGRQAAGKSLAEVSAALHLSESYLKALEADDYERLPEPTFVRGYIRNYARLLSLPGNELANLYQQLIDEAQPPATENDESEQQRPAIEQRYWLLAGGALLAFLLLWLLWPAGPVSEQSVGGLPEAALSGSASAGTDISGAAVENGAAIDSVDTELDPPVAELDDKGSVSSALPATQTVPVNDALVLRFAEVCWLRVRDVAGEEIYVGQRDAGETLTLSGQSPFRITLGNAAAVSAIEVNQTPITVPQAAPGQVVTVRAP